MLNNAIIRVFDNGGKTFDRYTVVIYEEEDRDGIDVAYAGVFGMSLTCDQPNGFNQYCGSVAENPLVLDALAGEKTALGKEVELTDLPKVVLHSIANRL
jgi:hypothetical protein